MPAADGDDAFVVDLLSVVVAARAPRRLAAFWAEALRWAERPSPDEDAVELMPEDGTTFAVEFRSGAHDKRGQNRIHFDLTTRSLDDQHATVDELIARGAVPVDIGQGPEEPHVVLADPEGNELCVIEPTNRFLAGCPRLGAVNCDGTAALGRFWSAALGWPLVWDQDEETAIQAPGRTGPKITWSGPPLMPVLGEPRLHFHVAAAAGRDPRTSLDRLLALGATHQRSRRCADGIALRDVDHNTFCLVDRSPETPGE